MSRLIWYITILLCGLIFLFAAIFNLGLGVKDDVETCLAANETQVDTCVNHLAQARGPTVCKHVEVVLYRDCIMHAAMGRNHPRTCKKMKSDHDYSECIGKVALFNNDRHVLDNIDEKKIKEEWLRKLADKYNETLPCRFITDVNIHGQCYHDIAKKVIDEEICYTIDQASIYRDMCFYDMAQAKRDPLICEPMTTIRKDKCIIDASV